MLRRPEADEYDGYYALYVRQVPAGDVLETLSRQIELTGETIARVPPELETFRYQSGKWSVREVVGHMADVERTFAYRALWFARADPSPLPGLEQDDWGAASNASERPLAELYAELALARMSHVAMFRGFDDAAWLRRGVASGFEFTVRSLPYLMAGHEIHHRRVLEERYLAGTAS